MSITNSLKESSQQHNTLSNTTNIDDQSFKECGEIENQKNAILGIRQQFREDIKEFSALKPWKTYTDIALQWIIIASTMSITIYLNQWPIWIIAIFIIAGRQHALLILGHEAAHFRISHNRKINDFVGDFFCLLPIFLCLKRWQQEHLQHHRHVNTKQDPYWDDFNKYEDWYWPKSKSEARRVILRDVLGINTKTNFEAAKRWSPFGKHPINLDGQDTFRIYLIIFLLIAGLTWSNGWGVFVLLWIIPLLTFSSAFIRIRSLSEHLGIDGLGNTSGIDATRHVDANWLERMTICPYGINYHIDHHIFPSVPYYNLARFHKKLMRNDLYQKYAIIKSGYFGKNGVWEEVTS